jgi:hypothetical protein
MPQLTAKGGVDRIQGFKVDKNLFFHIGPQAKRVHRAMTHAQTTWCEQGKQRIMGSGQHDFLLGEQQVEGSPAINARIFNLIDEHDR